MTVGRGLFNDVDAVGHRGDDATGTVADIERMYSDERFLAGSAAFNGRGESDGSGFGGFVVGDFAGDFVFEPLQGVESVIV